MTNEKKIGTDVVEAPKVSLLAKFGKKYSVAPEKVYDTLCKTAFADATSVEQVIALLVVADQYGLNPFIKEIYAFPDKKGGVVPVVGVDGWNTIAQNHDQYDGIEFNYSDDMVIPEGGKECPEWVEVVIYRKDRSHAVVIREYLDECYKKAGKYPGPWQTHTKRMLRHKALIQGYRTAFGFHGIYDPDEAANFIDIDSVVEPPSPGRQTRSGTESIQEALGEPTPPGPETEPEVEEKTTGEAPEQPEGEKGGLGI